MKYKGFGVKHDIFLWDELLLASMRSVKDGSPGIRREDSPVRRKLSTSWLPRKRGFQLFLRSDGNRFQALREWQ